MRLIDESGRISSIRFTMRALEGVLHVTEDVPELYRPMRARRVPRYSLHLGSESPI